jgi:hypothetical protein
MMHQSKPVLRIGFHSMWNEPGRAFNATHNYFSYLFQQRFEIELVNEHADILIYSVYGKPPTDRNAKRKVYFPNEVSGTLCDQARFREYEQYADAILTCNPTGPKDIYFGHFVIYTDWWRHGLGRHLPQGTSPGYLVDLGAINSSFSLERLTYRTKGCSIFMNNPAHPRSQIIESIGRWIQIHSYGSLYNNTYGPFDGDEYDKIVEASRFTHSLAIENTITHGYCSEKLLHSFASGTIPIYWGDCSSLKKYFNEELVIYISQEILERGRVSQHLERRMSEIMDLGLAGTKPKPLRIDRMLEDFGPAIILEKILNTLAI